MIGANYYFPWPCSAGLHSLSQRPRQGNVSPFKMNFNVSSGRVGASPEIPVLKKIRLCHRGALPVPEAKNEVLRAAMCTPALYVSSVKAHSVTFSGHGPWSPLPGIMLVFIYSFIPPSRPLRKDVLADYE